MRHGNNSREGATSKPKFFQMISFQISAINLIMLIVFNVVMFIVMNSYDSTVSTASDMMNYMMELTYAESNIKSNMSVMENDMYAYALSTDPSQMDGYSKEIQEQQSAGLDNLNSLKSTFQADLGCDCCSTNLAVFRLWIK